MGGHPGNGGRRGLRRTGAVRRPEEQAEEELLPQKAGGGIPNRSGHVTHLSDKIFAEMLNNSLFFNIFFVLVLRLDNGEPLDFGQVAYYNSGLQEDNIQMSNIPTRY